MKLRKLFLIALMTTTIILLTNTFVQAKTVVVDTDTLRLRKEKSTDATTIELLDNGTKLEYIEEDGDWYKVKYNGMVGFVSKDYVKVQEDPNSNKENNKPEENKEPEVTPTEEIKQEVTPTPEERQAKPTEQQVAVPTEMKVSKDSNIYILPLINANTIQEIKKDSNVKILSKTNGWYYVETDEAMGWIREASLMDSTVVSDDIDISDQDENKEEKKDDTKEVTGDTQIENKTMYVSSSSVFVRKGPGTEYEDIDALVLNDSVKVVGENGDWYKIDINGNVGYVAKRLLSESQTNTTTRSETSRTVEQVSNTNEGGSSTGNAIVDFAKQYLGRPYVYGASGPNSFDCSGFTMYVFENFGVTLSHSATAQSKVGTYVEKEDLQPGDLVFFTDYETGYGIGHVGIYIGGGDFIHASSGTGYCVKTSTLLSGSYYNRYETARRVL